MKRSSPLALSLLAVLMLTAPQCTLAQEKPASALLASPKEMAASLEDLWGEAALRRPDGPSYEFFKNLLPPLRYVNTEFRHYPIVLGAPGGKTKGRYVANGAAVNARASKKPMWKEIGFPVHFFVGGLDEPFGQDLARLDGPRYAEGYLPIVQVAYRQDKTTYEQEAFSPVEGALAEHGAVFLRFTARGAGGSVAARVGREDALSAEGGAVLDRQGLALVLFDTPWKWDGAKKELRCDLAADRSATLAVLTLPLPKPLPLDGKRYAAERKACVDRWQGLLAAGARFEVPEKIINDAWRALVIGNYLIAVGDRMHYSAGNAYDHLYEGECGDSTRALLLFGHQDDARKMVGPLLDFDRAATRFHVAGHKLQLLAHYYWVTRDKDYLREKEKAWQGPVDFLVKSRKQTDNGLLPRDNYAGDIAQQVYALNSNANCWRGLRDLAAVLDDLGDKDGAAALFAEAADFRKAILAAVARSEQRDTKPPFIPNALFGAEKAYGALTDSRLGSYYDLMAPYIIGSGVFRPDDKRETWMIDYLREHGGLAMGMMRVKAHQEEFNGEPGVNVLYGLRLVLAQLRRDDVGRAQVAFYGQLAQGMTRDTFIGGEGSRFFHGDKNGRSFYLPPNSTSNAMFLTTLRYLLIQDWDLDDDGRPDTLRLLYGAPRRWLENGAKITVERAPTMFGDVSFSVESRLAAGEVRIAVSPPKHRPRTMLVRAPLPAGWRLAGARVGHTALPVTGDGAVDVSGQERTFELKLEVQRQQ
jgi:hypothetical protein